MTATRQVYDNDGAAFVSLQIDKIGSGFQFTEGPLWHPDGCLLFSDTPANKIYQLIPGKSATVYLDKSGFSGTDTSCLSDMTGSNGLAWDEQGQLIICQHGNHAIAALDKNNQLHNLVNNYEGRPLNSPNDLVVSNDGSIYFTDPPYGLKDQVLHPGLFQGIAGLYRYCKGNLKLLNKDLRYPNGICFSPGEEFLYTGSNHPDEPFIWKCTLTKNGDIKDRSVFIQQNADGIKTDRQGRLFLATDSGILIVSPAGKKLALLPLPESPSNLAWGGKDHNELFVTARSSVYRLRDFL